MKTSVIVVTFNRRKDCEEALKSLINQVLLPDEIIVIDNGSTTPYKLKSEALEDKVNIIIIHLKKSIELGAARSIGVLLSSGDIVAFLDDDAIAAPRWLKSFKEAIEKGCDIATGPCKPLYLAKPPSWWDEKLHGDFVGVGNYYHVSNGDPLRYVKGGNMAVRRRVFDEIGLFKPYLGRVRGKLLSGEESDFVVRAMRKRFSVCYVPGAVMYHKVYPYRLGFWYMMKRSWNGGVSRRKLAFEGTIRPGPVLRSLYYMVDILFRVFKACKNMIVGDVGRSICEIGLIFNRLGFLIGNPL